MRSLGRVVTFHFQQRVKKQYMTIDVAKAQRALAKFTLSPAERLSQERQATSELSLVYAEQRVYNELSLMKYLSTLNIKKWAKNKIGFCLQLKPNNNLIKQSPLAQFSWARSYWDGVEGMGFNFSRFAVFRFLLTTAIAAIVSLYYLLNTIRPNIDYKSFFEKNPGMVQKSHIFYGSVANMSYEQFQKDEFDYKEDLRSQVFTNAKIAYTKFQNYLEGFFWFKLMMLSAA